jgi:hypothetical protein
MSLRHTVYCRQDPAAITPDELLNHLKPIDFWTLGEDYDIHEKTVNLALPLRIKNIEPERFRLYHLTYGSLNTRPIEIDRWETPEQHRAEIEEMIENRTIQDAERLKKITQWLRESIDRVSVSFGIDPPAAMFAWEVVRYIASKFDGIIRADDDEWLIIGKDYQPRRV